MGGGSVLPPPFRGGGLGKTAEDRRDEAAEARQSDDYNVSDRTPPPGFNLHHQESSNH